MLTRRGSHACAVLEGQLYAVGGWAAQNPLVSLRPPPQSIACQIHSRGRDLHPLLKAESALCSMCMDLLLSHAVGSKHHYDMSAACLAAAAF